MRYAVLAICLLGCASSAFAQAEDPRPFLVISQIEVGRSDTRGTFVGFDGTVGVPVGRHARLFGHVGRSHGLRPDALISRLDAALRDASAAVGRPVTGAFWMPAWYGTAGGRWDFSRAWRFQPYVEASAGAARVTSAIEYHDLSSGQPLDVTIPSGALGAGRSAAIVPTSILGVGTHIYFGRTFTLDAGYRHQRYFGAADATDRGPFLGFGVRF